jgi:hypothetical protein
LFFGKPPATTAVMKILIKTNNFGDSNHRMFGDNSNQMTFTVPISAFDNSQKLTISGDRLYGTLGQDSRPNYDVLTLKVQNSSMGVGSLGGFSIPSVLA